jgi:hypothetical protein
MAKKRLDAEAELRATGDPAEPDDVLTPDAVITPDDRLFPYDKGQPPATEAVKRRPRRLRGGGRRGAAQYTQREQERDRRR